MRANREIVGFVGRGALPLVEIWSHEFVNKMVE